MSLSSRFERPLLIYDDKCFSCGKFARWASILSRGWIRTAGHYYSEDAKKAKELIFPANYDSTKMFWIVNRNGVYGARSALLPLLKEIINGFFRKMENHDDYIIACEYKEMSCYTTTNTVKRIFNLLRNSGSFSFVNTGVVYDKKRDSKKVNRMAKLWLSRHWKSLALLVGWLVGLYVFFIQIPLL